jgi:hypothetical protein
VVWLRHMKDVVVGLLVWLVLFVWWAEWWEDVHGSSWIGLVVRFLIGLLGL